MILRAVGAHHQTGAQITLHKPQLAVQQHAVHRTHDRARTALVAVQIADGAGEAVDIRTIEQTVHAVMSRARIIQLVIIAVENED